jgi:hypothetical protein
MKPLPTALLGLLALLATGAAAPTTQTIVLIRHGEKPEAGLGQLDCQGLNRALALPDVIKREFGRPDAVYAPDPSQTKPDHGIVYDYVRPLATVEPLAIAMGLPVHASIGGTHIDLLQKALEAPDHRNSVVLVAWEHVELVKLTRRLMSDHGGNAKDVPDWKSPDYDGIYVVRLTWSGDKAAVAFERRAQHLDGQSNVCPGPAPHG